MRSALTSPRSAYKSYDAFAKPMEGIRTPTTTGGIITVAATFSASLLLLSQLWLYLQVDTRHSLKLSTSHPLNVVIPTDGGGLTSFLSSAMHKSRKRRQKVPVDLMTSISTLEKNQIDMFVHMTFPQHACDEVNYYNNGQKENINSKYFRGSKIHKGPPTEYDFAIATKESTVGKSKKLISQHPNAKKACTLRGTITIPKMEGDFGIQLSPTQWTSALEYLRVAQLTGRPMSMGQAITKAELADTTFYIHEIKFGKPYPHQHNPLKKVHVNMGDLTSVSSSVGLAAFNVKLIPTQHKRPARRVQELLQTSVSDYSIPAPILAMTNPPKVPGFWMHYDVSPISVHHLESRENFMIFLSDVISIVGGVFVTVGLVSACLINSASAVAKKMD